MGQERPICDVLTMSARPSIPDVMLSRSKRRSGPLTEVRRLILVSLNPAYAARTRRQGNRNAKAHLLVTLAPAQYKCIGCSPGKSNHTRTMATGSDDDSRYSVHDRSLCIAVWASEPPRSYERRRWIAEAGRQMQRKRPSRTRPLQRPNTKSV
jgi:hypothetical protein